MKQKTKSGQSVAEFLSTASKRRLTGGNSCASCRLHNIRDVERAVIEWMNARKSGETIMMFGTFFKAYLKPTFSLPFAECKPLQRHMAGCRGKTIQN